jgi:hypothetical protein
MAREVATAYTGANVSITIGPDLITNAFGISWELSQNKRPIYGYNSMHYDTVATGQVIVLGQLYINYQHPNYLSRILYDYFQERRPANYRDTGVGNSFNPLLTNMISASYNVPQESGVIANRGSLARQNMTYDQVLDSLHSDPALAANLGSIFTGGTTVTNKTLVSQNGKGVEEVQSSFSQSLSLGLSHNLSRGGKRDIASIYARPDHFTNNQGLVDQINIIVTYGDPGMNTRTAGIMSYMPSSSIILKGIQFIGESQQVMSDDQPIMETYKFIARCKETLVSKVASPSE